MGRGVELRTNVKYQHAKVDQSVSLLNKKYITWCMNKILLKHSAK